MVSSTYCTDWQENQAVPRPLSAGGEGPASSQHLQSCYRQRSKAHQDHCNMPFICLSHLWKAPDSWVNPHSPTVIPTWNSIFPVLSSSSLPQSPKALTLKQISLNVHLPSCLGRNCLFLRTSLPKQREFFAPKSSTTGPCNRVGCS